MRQHAALGELIVKDVPNAAEVTAAIGAHHERMDGRGYPKGLRGASIPMLARVLAVADSYSAMTTDRPYREALSPDAASAELLQGRGGQFDPELVDAFLAALAMPDSTGSGYQLAREEWGVAIPSCV